MWTDDQRFCSACALAVIAAFLLFSLYVSPPSLPTVGYFVLAAFVGAVALMQFFILQAREAANDSNSRPELQRPEERHFWERHIRHHIRVAIWLNCITGVGTVVGLVGLVFVYLTLESAERSTTIANRAWIAPLRIVVEDKFRLGEKFAYRVAFQNVGKEPATNIVIDAVEGTIDAPAVAGSWDAVFTRSGVKKYDCQKVHPNSGGLVTYPSVSPPNEFTASTDKLIPDEDAVLNGTKILYVKGCFGYETFNEGHYSWFCYYWTPIRGRAPNANAPVLCPGGTNGAD